MTQTAVQELVPQWSEEQMDQIQDFIGTVHGWQAGHVLSQDDLSGLKLYLEFENVEGEHAVEAYHTGVAKGRHDAATFDEAALLARADKAESELIVERSTNKAMALYRQQENAKLSRILLQQVGCIGNLAKKLGYSGDDIRGMTASARDAAERLSH